MNLKVLSLTLVASAMLLSSCGDGNQKKESTTTEAQEVTAVTDASAVTLSVDPAQSLVEWNGWKVVVNTLHNGSLKLQSGEVTGNLSSQEIMGGKFVVDMASLSNYDQEGDMKTMLEDHLKSADFFDVEKYPTSVFEITSAEKLAEGNGRYKISGNLTIKDITNNIEFMATIKDDSSKFTAVTDTITIDRTKWNIVYGSGQGMKELTDKAIHDNMSFVATIVANK